MDCITIGSNPTAENCAQVGSIDYESRSIRECRVFRRMLERLLPVPPGVRAEYRIKSFAHDFGRYREVGVQFDENDPAAVDFAYAVERSTPERWDEAAITELLWFETRAVYARKLARGELDDSDVPEIYRTAAPPDRFEPCGSDSCHSAGGSPHMSAPIIYTPLAIMRKLRPLKVPYA